MGITRATRARITSVLVLLGGCSSGGGSGARSDGGIVVDADDPTQLDAASAGESGPASPDAATATDETGSERDDASFGEKDAGARADTTPQVDGGGNDADAIVSERPLPREDETVGDVCREDRECDRSGRGRAYCAPVGPTPLCVQLSRSPTEPACDPRMTGSTLPWCDGGRGLCLEDAAGFAACFPQCRVDAGATWQSRCPGSVSCVLEFLAPEATTPAQVVGTCRRGCTSDDQCDVGIHRGQRCDPVTQQCQPRCTPTGASACTGGRVCEVASGRCLWPRAVGDTCGSNVDCLCMLASGGTGYCTKVCQSGRVGDCPTGFACDGQLHFADRTKFFASRVPVGLSGFCRKECASAADCPSGDACLPITGTTRRVCMAP